MRAKLSQKELANALFVTQQAVGRWEVNSSSPNPETVVKIAEILGITSSELLGDNLPPPSPGGTWVPVLGDVAAGVPIETMEHILDYEEIDQQTASSGEFFALRINDNSMEPKISETQLPVSIIGKVVELRAKF